MRPGVPPGPGSRGSDGPSCPACVPSGDHTRARRQQDWCDVRAHRHRRGASPRWHRRWRPGAVHGGHAKVVIADTKTLKTTEVIDHMTMHDKELLLGWTRGLFLDGDRLWTGFLRMRATKFRDDVAWLKNGFRATSARTSPATTCASATASPRSTTRRRASTRCPGSTPQTERATHHRSGVMLQGGTTPSRSLTRATSGA